MNTENNLIEPTITAIKNNYEQSLAIQPAITAEVDSNNKKLKNEVLEKELQKLSQVVLAEKITELKTKYLPLRIEGISDHGGYLKVKEAHKDIRRYWNEIEKVRKVLKEDALRYGKAIDAKAREIKNKLEPIQNYLKNQMITVDNEKERYWKKEEMDALQNTLWDEAQNEYNNREVLAAAKKKAEEDRLKKEAEEREKQIREDERKKAEADLEIKLEKERKKAEKETQEKLRKEWEKQEQEHKKKEIAALEASQELSDAEKIKAYVQSVLDIPVPNLRDDNLSNCIENVRQASRNLLELV